MSISHSAWSFATPCFSRKSCQAVFSVQSPSQDLAAFKAILGVGGRRLRQPLVSAGRRPCRLLATHTYGV
jgi:hypothetical protein